MTATKSPIIHIYFIFDKKSIACKCGSNNIQRKKIDDGVNISQCCNCGGRFIEIVAGGKRRLKLQQIIKIQELLESDSKKDKKNLEKIFSKL